MKKMKSANLIIISSILLMITLTSIKAKKELKKSVAIIANGPGVFDFVNDIVDINEKDYSQIANSEQGIGNGYLYPEGQRMMFNLGG
jgi:hypothetical protein